MYQIDFENPVHVFFIGIGGISMSGLAEILLSEGFKVSGSDRQRSSLTETLTGKGAAVYYGHSRENLNPLPDLIVYTNGAIKDDNPELAAGRELNIPILTRAQLLGQLMNNYKTPIAVSGTHGKTTTTSMLSAILLKAGTDPTLSIGGIFKEIGGNFRLGKSGYFVTEACEYTNSFLSLFPKIGIILNIEEDHLDFFKDINDIRNSFRQFAKLLPSASDGGALIINGDISNLEEITSSLSCRVITYGMSSGCDYVPADITYDEFGHPSFTIIKAGAKDNEPYFLRVPGLYNVQNACAAIAAAEFLGIENNIIRKALSDFSGTDRRFEYKGEVNGFSIIDDYAHHPTEITTTLRAAQNYPHQKLWCVFQPHTYSRTKAFMDGFARALTLADRVVLTDIYAAREKDTLGISSRDLQAAIQKLGGQCDYFSSFEEAEKFLLENCINGDLLITMGAGDVHKIGESLLQK